MICAPKRSEATTMPRKTKSRTRQDDEQDVDEPITSRTWWWAFVVVASVATGGGVVFLMHARAERQEAKRQYDICEFDLQAATAYLKVKAIAPARERLVHAKSYCGEDQSSTLTYLVDELDTLERAAARSRP
jgi:hypothetical protein